jgi:hypothetical protein
MAGRPGKDDTAKPALLALIEHGASVPEACQIAGVVERTFYAYQNDDPEFSQGVARAREAWAARQDAEVNGAAARSLIRYLLEGETTERTVEETTIRDGKEVTRRSRVIERRPCPKWVFDKLMPDTLVQQLHQHLHVHGEGEALEA